MVEASHMTWKHPIRIIAGVKSFRIRSSISSNVTRMLLILPGLLHLHSLFGFLMKAVSLARPISAIDIPNPSFVVAPPHAAAAAALAAAGGLGSSQ